MKKFLIYVDIVNGIQSNKFYNMEISGDECIATYGRVGSKEMIKSYPRRRFDSIYRSKLRKGYQDITHLKETSTNVKTTTENKDFNEFLDNFSKYTQNLVSKTYITDKCTPIQKNEAQGYLNDLSTARSVDEANDLLLAIYKTVPRKMNNVRNFLIKDINEIKEVISVEQDALDGMDSSNIIQETNVLDHLGLDFKAVTDQSIVAFINETNPGKRVKVHRIYNIKNTKWDESFGSWLNTQDNKDTKLLIHGTRNSNIFSILKQGLLIRPSNAAMITGAAYGNGIYHSTATAKSLNYTGYDRDKLFLMQKVHVGRMYEYSGWYREGKSLSRSRMNYEGLKELGYDSLYVKPGDGLLNSEYIVYNQRQSITNYLVWLR